MMGFLLCKMIVGFMFERGCLNVLIVLVLVFINLKVFVMLGVIEKLFILLLRMIFVLGMMIFDLNDVFIVWVNVI